MPVCTQTFWVASGLRLTALPLAHHMHMQAWLTYRSPFSSPSGSPQAYQCAHRPFGLPLCSLLSPWLTMHLHTWFSHQITFRFTIRLASCQCAHRPFGLPLGSLLYSKLTRHLPVQLTHQITFWFTIGLASSMPVCTQTFWLASGLSDLALVHHASASSARPWDHLLVHHEAHIKHASKQEACQCAGDWYEHQCAGLFETNNKRAKPNRVTNCMENALWCYKLTSFLPLYK